MLPARLIGGPSIDMLLSMDEMGSGTTTALIAFCRRVAYSITLYYTLLH